MKVVILAGGKGMRMKELTENIPKGMLKIRGRTMIEHVMDGFKKYGYDDFVIAAGYKFEAIRKHFLRDKNVRVINTGVNTKTGGRIKKLRKFLRNESCFFVCYADGLANVDFDKFLMQHVSHCSVVSMVVTRPKSQFGVLKVDHNLVKNFEEKPVLPYWINSGFFIFDKEIFKYLDNGMFEMTTLPKLARQEKILAFKHAGFWKCMDTFKDYKDFVELAKDKPWGIKYGIEK